MMEAQVYEKHRNLKLAAAELGITWQTLYVRLRRAGVAVIGDKMRYGTDRDRLGAMSEAQFQQLVPYAVSKNAEAFQAKYDFDVAGHKVDVKASMPRRLNKRHQAESWAFSFKKQSLVCDFIVCFCLNEERAPEHILLVPKEFFAGLQTVSVSRRGDSKWLDYAVKPSELAEFFSAVPQELTA
jgi:hypothetical protein